ncbi:fungal-specific transcription factor domain-containing protein [Trichoderma chlorosporum]
MSSVGEPFMEGLFLPRIIRDNGFCLNCRRSGKQCDTRLPTCVNCQANDLKCIQPISACPPDESDARKRRRISAEPEDAFLAETEEEFMTDDESVTESEAETEILTSPTPGSQSKVVIQPQSPSQPQTQQNENDENAAPGPGWSVFMSALSRQIDQAQHRVLQRTTGHIRFPLSPLGPDSDPDHDYAVYYDYKRDLGSSDDTAIDGSDRNRRRNHTPYTLESISRTSTVYEVKNTWTGGGPPPLLARLDDFIDYMRECHLSHAPSSALPLAFLPACGNTTANTLMYYVRRPTNRGTAPLPDINPLNPKLLDLAYSNPLALQLIIAQRADHREVSTAVLPTGERAERFHRSSIGAFAPKIQSYLAGNEEDMLPLTMGSLILALTEKARLDKRGQGHNYPTAASSILVMLTTSPQEDICENLPSILVEYYMHTTMFACLAANVTTARGIPFVSEAFRDAVDKLASNSYQGRLCGTWLRVMVCIHSIFELGIKMRPYINSPSGTPAPGPSTGYLPNHFVTFSRIQERLFAFGPALDESSTDFQAAVLWRNAALLYLWSLLEWPNAPKPPGSCANLTSSAYHDALQRLKEIRKEGAVNKTLCWPLLVIGCYATDKVDQIVITKRLLYIWNHFKTGNALETYYILKHIWAQPLDKRSPWLVYKSIQETKCCGSLFGTRLL